MSNQQKRIPTTEKLAEALRRAKAPTWMINNALAGTYDDYKSEIPMPIMQLVQDARACHLDTLVERAKNGEFDAQKWEADEWAKSEEGQATFAEFFKGVEENAKKKKS